MYLCQSVTHHCHSTFVVLEFERDQQRSSKVDNWETCQFLLSTTVCQSYHHSLSQRLLLKEPEHRAGSTQSSRCIQCPRFNTISSLFSPLSVSSQHCAEFALPPTLSLCLFIKKIEVKQSHQAAPGSESTPLSPCPIVIWSPRLYLLQIKPCRACILLIKHFPFFPHTFRSFVSIPRFRLIKQ